MTTRVAIGTTLVLASGMAGAGAAAAPTYLHAGRLLAVPGQTVRGASTVMVEGERIVAVRDGLVPRSPGATLIGLRIGITGQSLAMAAPAGIKIAFGTDVGVSKHGRNADKVALMVNCGMTPAEAIKAATVAGDPLADVRVLKAVGVVMARGAVVKSDDAR